MDTLLIIVTALSLLMAAGMSFVVMKLLRDERRRSDARVALLETWVADGAPSRVETTAPEAAERVARDGSAAVRDRERAAAAPKGPSVRIRPEARAADLPLREPIAPVDPPLDGAVAAEMFAEPERSSPWGPRLAVIGAMAAVLLTAGFLMYGWTDAVPASEAQRPAAAAVVPLELLSLRYDQQPDTLKIAGIVQNPRGAAPLTRVVATAFAFSADGTFLASGRAPLDFTSLAGGDESPFVVTIPVSGNVARYRVGFRTEDGRVLAHVDKRGDTIAQR